MSYLDAPRINFSGVFQADPSTVNNDVRYYQNEAFRPEYQQQRYPTDEDPTADGYWNPEGTGVFRFIDCSITGAVLGEQLFSSPQQDPIIGLRLENADQQAPGKIVDLDPQMQYASQLWGMQVRLASADERALFIGDLLPVAFMNLWRRQLNTTSNWEQPMAASYQTILHNVQWHHLPHSPVLQALKDACPDGRLSINFNLYGYTRDNQSQRFTMGLISGSIGPYHPHEPKHFVMGRHLLAPLLPTPPNAAPFPNRARSGVFGFQCQHDRQRQKLSADFGLALPIVDASGELHNLGTLTLALYHDPDNAPGATTLQSGQFLSLGTLDYLQPDWYRQTAGIQIFDYQLTEQDQVQPDDSPQLQLQKQARSALKKLVALHIDSSPLLLLGPQAGDGSYPVLVQEAADGRYVQSDDHVCRLNPDQPQTIDVYASEFGKPLATTLYAWQIPPGNNNSNPQGGSGMGDNSLSPPVEIPNVGTLPENLQFQPQLQTNVHGLGQLTLIASPKAGERPRRYIDGQLYAVSYGFQPPPADIAQRAEPPAGGPYSNYWNFISVLAFNRIQQPAHPSWKRDIQPILQQYGHLYPIMSKYLVDLNSYPSVRRHSQILKLAFSLPQEDPNYMPVSRDLSAAKRSMLLQWLDGLIHRPAELALAGDGDEEIIEIEIQAGAEPGTPPQDQTTAGHQPMRQLAK